MPRCSRRARWPRAGATISSQPPLPSRLRRCAALRRAPLQVAHHFAQLFHCVAAGTAAAGLPPVRLSRWDLFHGHLFACHQRGALGVLFHCREYPAFDEAAFPYSLGFCQAGSELRYEAAAQDWRNVLWYQVGGAWWAWWRCGGDARGGGGGTGGGGAAG
jgi:hypothetical protein